LTEILGQDPAEVTQLLWAKYDPGCVWIPFSIAGIVAAVALSVFNHFAKKWQEVNA
jgi:hypothetical protein